MSFRFARAGAALLAFGLAGCAGLGPNYLAAGRPLYNEAVQQTEAQQLLLNIVRQRYNDPVMFLDVTNITSKATYSVGGTARATIPFTGTNGSFAPDLTPRLEDSPSIFYTPNNGEKFVRQVLTPLDLRTLALVLQAGWSIERVLLLAGESVNGLRNGGGADYPALAQAMRDLQRNGDMMVGVDGAMPASGIVLSFSPAARDMAAYQIVCKALRGACNGEPLQLRAGLGVPANGAPASLQTRSIYSALYFLADGVDVPPGDTGAARARNPNGPAEDLFRIRTSSAEPAAAAVKIRYRDAWFYIADADGDSKVTFALLSMLLTLQAGDSGKMAPLLTIPAS